MGTVSRGGSTVKPKAKLLGSSLALVEDKSPIQGFTLIKFNSLAAIKSLSEKFCDRKFNTYSSKGSKNEYKNMLLKYVNVWVNIPNVKRDSITMT